MTFSSQDTFPTMDFSSEKFNSRKLLEYKYKDENNYSIAVKTFVVQGYFCLRNIC
jgi:hypothetical protein